jgi:hypothetical protein
MVEYARKIKIPDISLGFGSEYLFLRDLPEPQHMTFIIIAVKD